eukprot:373114_1
MTNTTTTFLFLIVQLLIWDFPTTIAYLPASQIAALVDFYISLNGDNWTNCKWNLTELATNYTLENYYCGLTIEYLTYDTHSVYEIVFYFDNNLNGTIPQTIDMLPDLEVVGISDNILLKGTVPHTICNLVHLTEITFDFTSLYGFIPECIGNMSLTAIELGYTSSLSIKDTVIQLLCLHATELTVLSFYWINYVGNIPECIGNQLSKLQWISFSNASNLNSTMP